MTPPNPQMPQVSTPPVPKGGQSTKTIHKHQTKKHKNKFQPKAPAHNKISRTQAAEAPPASRTIARTQLKKLENKTLTGYASTVYAAIAQLENNAHQALAVMNTNNDKLLSYRQLMRNPKLKKIGSSPQRTNSDVCLMVSADALKTQLTKSRS